MPRFFQDLCQIILLPRPLALTGSRHRRLVILRLFRVRNVLALKCAWTLVLATAFLMPLLLPIASRLPPRYAGSARLHALAHRQPRATAAQPVAATVCIAVAVAQHRPRESQHSSTSVAKFPPQSLVRSSAATFAALALEQRR